MILTVHFACTRDCAVTAGANLRDPQTYNGEPVLTSRSIRLGRGREMVADVWSMLCGHEPTDADRTELDIIATRGHYVCHREGDTCSWAGCPEQRDDRACEGCFLRGPNE